MNIFTQGGVGQSDIVGLSIEELQTDRAESLADLETCETHYLFLNAAEGMDSDIPYLKRRLEERIQGNKAIIRVIDAELERRKNATRP